jgi:hypothetical protein
MRSVLSVSLPEKMAAESGGLVLFEDIIREFEGIFKKKFKLTSADLSEISAKF